MNLVGVLFEAGLIYLILISLSRVFMAGPSVMLIHFNTPDWLYLLIGFFIFLLIPLLAIDPYFILKRFGHVVSRKNLMISLVIFAVSVPVSIIMIDIFDRPGWDNAIHTINTFNTGVYSRGSAQ